MSPQDISRIQPIAPGRNIAREPGDTAAKAAARPAIDRQNDSAVKVETGVSVDQGTQPGQVPVDRSRVEVIRNAIQQGAYPVNPAKIADAMIAAPLLLSVER